MPDMLEHHAAPAHSYSCLCIAHPPPPNPAGGALVPEMLEQRHAEFLADAQQFMLRGGQVRFECSEWHRLGWRMCSSSCCGAGRWVQERWGGSQSKDRCSVVMLAPLAVD